MCGCALCRYLDRMQPALSVDIAAAQRRALEAMRSVLLRKLLARPRVD